jgi:hypothetical protein
MLSSVLNSERAVQMNIVIMRAFVKLREVLATHKALARKIEQMQHTQRDHAAILSIVVKNIQDLEETVAKEFKRLKDPGRRKPRIGFVPAQRNPVHPSLNRIHRRVSAYIGGCLLLRINSYLIQIPFSHLPVAADSAILISFNVIHTQNSRRETWL